MESDLQYSAKSTLADEFISKLDDFPFKNLTTWPMNIDNTRAFYNDYFNDESSDKQKNIAYLMMFASLSTTLASDIVL